MVDQDARNILAEGLRHLVSGRISNDEFEVRAMRSSRDRGVRVVQDQAWCLYSDLYEHRLVGEHRVSRSDRAVVARMIMFLYSGTEYGWPAHPVESFAGAILNFVTFGLASAVTTPKWKRSGAFEVWPFLSVADFERARRRPRLLSRSAPK